MKKIILIALLAIIVVTQSTVKPKTQACECKNLLNQIDCTSQKGCLWTLSNTNSTTNQTTTSNGICALATTTITIPTYCSTITMTQCASILGCANVDNICTIFTGCQAYVQTTNQACQSISSQCTTDGSRCISPTSCSNYSTEILCRGNIASSGAKSCLWNDGKCVDKTCSDAPITFNTNLYCQNWINGCVTSGRGCALTLNTCSTYKRADGCQGMVGSDGNCVENTSEGSTICRKAECSDAPITISTNEACSLFQTGCLSNGRGCVQFLTPCNSYNIPQQCQGLIGQDGPCTTDTTEGSTKCRALKCTEAPNSLNTNSACSQFLSGCVTTGYGCDDSLKLCSSYQGTSATCDLIIGSDGKCKGTSSVIQSCARRSCSDAPSSNNTDQACNLYQTGCITTGAGCTDTLKSCSSYQGTYTTCAQYIGNDGNCTAPQNQVEQGACTAKVCTDAPKTLKTNLDCQNYSKKCIASGQGCIESVSCLLISYDPCQSNPACSAARVCLDRSRCANYSNQSQCSLNKQYYQSGGNTYIRPCVWQNNSCQDILCSSLPTTLTTDDACSGALPGCLTKGQGCVDVGDPCTSYQGLIECFGFKGLNGTQRCFQLSSVQDSQTNCIIVNNCSQANTIGPAFNNDSNCKFLLNQCYYNGKDNCTDGDCNSFYGTQKFCGQLKNAKSGGTPQACWKVTDTSGSNTACVPRQCSQAPTTNISNTLCDQFMKGCLWNGTSAGGCQDPTTACTQYKGNQSQCETFSESGKQCTAGSVACVETTCTNIKVPQSAASNTDKGSYCQSFVNMNGYNCLWSAGDSCEAAIFGPCSKYIALGADDVAKQQYCQTLMYSGGPGCSYVTGDNCSQAQCEDFTAVGTDADSKALYCKSIILSSQKSQCALINALDTTCRSSQCSNYDIKTQDACQQFSASCFWNPSIQKCAGKLNNCTDYQIPDGFTKISELQLYCAGQASTASTACGIQISFGSRLLGGSLVCSDLSRSCQAIRVPASAVQVQVENLSGVPVPGPAPGSGPTIDEVMANLKFCSSMYVNGGTVQNCYFSNDQLYNCVDLSACDQYQAPSTQQQQFCSQLKDTDNRVCSYVSASANCNVPQQNCSDYFTFGDTVIANQNFCKQYFALSEFAYCGSNTSGSSTCKSFECSDYTQDDQCQSYNRSCIYNGSGCVRLMKGCSNYQIANTVQGQQSCFVLTSALGQCGWSNGTTCSQRQCSQLKSGLTLTTCKQFIACDSDPTKCCQYDGQSCLNIGSCASYVPHGQTDAEKAAICNKMVGTNGLCTFMVGSPNCIDTNESCSYNRPYPQTNEQAQQACSLAVDNLGRPCGFNVNDADGVCYSRSCDQILTAKSNSDCNAYLAGCQADLTNQTCGLKLCTDAASTLTTNPACQQFRANCLTNGNGCIESTELCSAYKGDQSTCNNFIGNGIPCTNNPTAISTSSCIERTCLLNITASKDSDCDVWYPPTGTQKNCVWNGSSGCVPPRFCSQFTGTNDLCSKVTAKDGPCFRKEANSGACSPTNTDCSQAPSTYNTDILCKSWGSSCITNGSGCIAQATATCANLSQSACPLYKSTAGLYCDLTDSCNNKPTTCNEYNNASDCNNIPLIGQDKVTCGWNSQNSSCGLLTCDQLPVTLTTDAGCSSIFPTCVTNGAGCVTKGPCSSYSRQNCGTAVTTDSRTCIWSNSTCRPIECTDNVTAQSDSACNAYLQGCKTTGAGCAKSLTCPQIKTPQLCQIDSQGLTCLWYKAPNDSIGSCITYSQCTDIIQSTHSACQAASPLCTTNGVTCVAITSCANTIQQASCIKGSDGNCGWLPAFQQNPASCQLFTQCLDAKGTTLQQCQSWGQMCISDGVQCLQKENCSRYLTQTACQSGGTDGQCYWAPQTEKNSAFCKLQQCSDATTNNLTHLGCSQFVAQTPCTTSGQGCIQLGLCSSYIIQEGCVQGTDGVCFWEQINSNGQSTQQCRLKQCTDVVLTTSSACSIAINGVKCVSNSTNCIQKQQCSSYINREACLGGGLDVNCAFKPTNISIPDIGTCQNFNSCQVADQDQVTCNSRSDVCFFNQTTINGTTTSSCQPHTCSTIQQGTCQAVPSFDLSEYKICVLSGTTCVDGNINQLSAQTCYQGSLATYTWNMATQTCSACVQKNTTINNSENNNTGSNTNGHLAKIMLLIIFYMI